MYVPKPQQMEVGDISHSENNNKNSLDIFNMSYESLTPIFHAFASGIRLQIIMLLAQRKHYVFELVDELGSSQPLVSQHLKVLKSAGIITSTRTGRQVQYELASPDITRLIDQALALEKLLSA